MRLSTLIILFVLLFAGCSGPRGFDRGTIKGSINSSTKITDDYIKKVIQIKPQITFPFKLGLYYERFARASFEKDLVWLEPLKKEGIISEIIPISSSTVEWQNDTTPLQRIRIAAARYGADAVLVMESHYDVDRYNNFSAFLYVTIIGGFLVPGTHSDVLVITEGTLWDVANEYLYLSVESEGLAKKIGPAFILKDKESLTEAREIAFAGFQSEFLKRMRNLKGTTK